MFIPRGPGAAIGSLDTIRKGDTVRVTGIALQYSPTTPYNGGYELVVADLGDIVLMEQPPAVPQPVIASGITVILLVGFFLWSRERRLRSQRRRLRQTYKLGEEILGASSPATILKRISEALPGIIGVTRVQLYVYNRTAKTLDAIEEDGGEADVDLSFVAAGRNPRGRGGLLPLPDAAGDSGYRPQPVPDGRPRTGERSPKSLLFVPMIAQSEVIGVLELDQDDRVRDFTADEQALAQHLGNQIGVAIRLLDQRTRAGAALPHGEDGGGGQADFGRGERTADAAGLDHESGDTARWRRRTAAPRNARLRPSRRKPPKPSGMVSRLVSLPRPNRRRRVRWTSRALLRSLIEFREGDWKATGIRVRDLTSRDALFVLGSQGQLEQVFLNLLVHAEQSLADAEQKSITIRTSVLAKRLLVEISFTSPSELRKPEDMAAVLGVTRSVIAGHGGRSAAHRKDQLRPAVRSGIAGFGEGARRASRRPTIQRAIRRGA